MTQNSNRLTSMTDLLLQHFGKEAQKKKLREEIFELTIACSNLALHICVKETENIGNEMYHKDPKYLFENVKEEFADCVVVTCQLHKYAFNKMYDLVYRNNAHFLHTFNRLGYKLNKKEILDICLSKCQRTIERYGIIKDE